MKKIIFSVTLTLGLGLTLGSQAADLKHVNGTITNLSLPATVATYDLAVLDTLTTLGVEVQGVPKANYSGIMAKYAEPTPVGTLFEPDYAQLQELQPSIIFAGRRTIPAIPELEKIAPTALFYAGPEDFIAKFNQENLALGKAFNKERQAKKHLKKINANLKKLHKANKGQTGALLFVVNNNIIAQAPGDRYSYAYEVTGLEAVLEPTDPALAAAPRPQAGSPEALAAQQARAQALSQVASAEPDWLLVLDRSAINGAPKTAQQVIANHPELSQTQAFKQGKVVYLEPNPWYIIGGGLNNFTAITQDLLKAMR